MGRTGNSWVGVQVKKSCPVYDGSRTPESRLINWTEWREIELLYRPLLDSQDPKTRVLPLSRPNNALVGSVAIDA